MRRLTIKDDLFTVKSTKNIIPNGPKDRMVKHLFRIYSSIRKSLNGAGNIFYEMKMLSDPKSHLRVFYKLQSAIEEYEEMNRTKVDIPIFMLAHFTKYRKHTFPFKMLQPRSFSMYMTFCNELNIPTKIISVEERIEVRDRVFVHLAKSWGISESESRRRFGGVL
jgi:hypothetical protein